jgi:hypothetical protein
MTKRGSPENARTPQRRTRRQNVEHPSARHAADTRASIAVLAARLIADGTDDFHLAKTKAARQLGLDAQVALPDNQEIDQALRQHHAIFASRSQPSELAALREISIDALRWLAEFSPWLSGPVLTGTANRFSAIELEFIGIEAKAFEMFLLNQNVEFDIAELGGHKPRRPGRTPDQDGALIRYDLEFEGVLLHIALFTSHAQREAAHPKNSQSHTRMQLAAAERAFDPRVQADPSSI